jgi:hypothetical protein
MLLKLVVVRVILYLLFVNWGTTKVLESILLMFRVAQTLIQMLSLLLSFIRKSTDPYRPIVFAVATHWSIFMTPMSF